MSTDELVVTGIGVASPWGNDPARLDPDDLAGGRPPIPDDAWCDAAEAGPRGFKYAPEACRHLLAATRRALADAGDCLQAVPPLRRGMAVGTTGANTALLDSMDETVTGPGADRLRPASAPYFSLNTIAGRIAMEYAVKGWNLTLTSPRTAGLEAVLAGARAGAAGRSDLLLAGSVETPLPPHNAGHPVSEAGSAILVIEPRASAAARSATAYGTCRVAAFFLPHPAGSAPQAVTGALARLLTPGGPVPATRLIAEDGPVAAAVAGQLRSLGSDVTLTPPGAGTLLPMLHIASALARGTAPHLVATASQDGTCALALVSPEPHRNPA